MEDQNAQMMAFNVLIKYLKSKDLSLFRDFRHRDSIGHLLPTGRFQNMVIFVWTTMITTAKMIAINLEIFVVERSW